MVIVQDSPSELHIPKKSRNFAASIKYYFCMKTSSNYRAQACETLRNHWTNAVLAAFVFLFTTGLLTGFSTGLDRVSTQFVFNAVTTSISGLLGLGSIFLLLPLQYALYTAFLQVARRENESAIQAMFNDFKRNYTNFLLSGLLTNIIVVLLSIVTLGIAGVIFAYAYRMVPYLIEDYPNLSTKEIMRTSREMMKGHKWDLFILDLSFIGWAFLAILTGCIGFLWLIPYQYTAIAHFYEDLKAERIVDTDEADAIEE